MSFYLVLACLSTNDHIHSVPFTRNDGLSLKISVSPSDANVSINDKPWVGQVISKGKHTIRLEKNGYETLEHVLFVQELDAIALSFSLESNRIPFRLYFPVQETFVLKNQGKTFSFDGSFSTSIHPGIVEVYNSQQQLIFYDEVEEPRDVYRCPQPIEQRSACVSTIKLPNPPLHAVFQADTVWLTDLGRESHLQSISLKDFSLKKYFLLGEKHRLYATKTDLYLLRESDGEIRYFNPQTLGAKVIHAPNIPRSNELLVKDKKMYVSSWLRNQVYVLEEDRKTAKTIKKPKSMLPFGDDIIVLGSQPASVSLLGKHTILQKNDSHFVRAVLKKDTQTMLIADTEKQAVWSFVPSSKQIEKFCQLESGEIRDIAIVNELVLLLIHYSGEGFSRGTGEIIVYAYEDKKIIDRIPTTNTPVRLFVSDELVVVSDLTFQSLLFFDVSVLAHDSQ